MVFPFCQWSLLPQGPTCQFGAGSAGQSNLVAWPVLHDQSPELLLYFHIMRKKEASPDSSSGPVCEACGLMFE